MDTNDSNNDRYCDHCNKPLIGKKSNSKFCDGKCRSAYHNTHRGEKPTNSYAPSLKNVSTIDINNPKPEASLFRSKPSADRPSQKILKIRNEINRNVKLLNEKQQMLEQLEQNDLGKIAEGLTDKAIALGKQKINQNWGGVLGGVVGFVGSAGASFLIPSSYYEGKNQRIASLKDKIETHKIIIKGLKSELKEESMFLRQNNNGTLMLDIDHGVSGHTKKNITQHSEPSQRQLSGQSKNKSVIPSTELINYDYKALLFTGVWLYFLGNPSTNFNMIIHGRAGEGKSTHAIQFANYLASYFGKVIYISGEEGFGKTFRDKFLRLEAASKDLFVADINKYEEIVKELDKNLYHFVFIDSLDTLKFGVDEMKKLRTRFPNFVFITISQSTKNGQMRGSNELKHDCDIEVSVSNGIATTEKNRFLEKGRTFEVFKQN